MYEHAVPYQNCQHVGRQNSQQSSQHSQRIFFYSRREILRELVSHKEPANKEENVDRKQSCLYDQYEGPLKDIINGQDVDGSYETVDEGVPHDYPHHCHHSHPVQHIHIALFFGCQQSPIFLQGKGLHPSFPLLSQRCYSHSQDQDEDNGKCQVKYPIVAEDISVWVGDHSIDVDGLSGYFKGLFENSSH